MGCTSQWETQGDLEILKKKLHSSRDYMRKLEKKINNARLLGFLIFGILILTGRWWRIWDRCPCFPMSNVNPDPKKTRWSIRSCSPYFMIVCLCFASTMVTPFVLNGPFFHLSLTGRPGWLVIDRGKTEFQAFHGIPTSKKMQMAGDNYGRSAGIGIWWGYHEIYPTRSCNTLKTGKHIKLDQITIFVIGHHWVMI